MPLIDVKCSACGSETEMFRHVSEMDEPLPGCENGCDGAKLERIYVYQRPHSYNGLITPTDVYLNPDGSIGICGERGARIPKGSERIELRTAADIRRIEHRMTEIEYGKFLNKQEREERHFGALQSEQRSELRQRMNSMSERGKAFARLAMKMNDNKPRQRFQTNVFFDAFSNNASNRDGYRGSDNRQGRK